MEHDHSLHNEGQTATMLLRLLSISVRNRMVRNVSTHCLSCSLFCFFRVTESLHWNGFVLDCLQSVSKNARNEIPRPRENVLNHLAIGGMGLKTCTVNDVS